MHEGFGRGDACFASAPSCDCVVMLTPNAASILANVGKKGGLFAFEHRRDIEISVWRKALRLAAGVDVKEIEAASAA